MVDYILSNYSCNDQSTILFINNQNIDFCRNEVPLMVISLGSISLKTEPRREDTKNVAAMHGLGAKSDEILKEIMDQAYDKFNLNIDNIQVRLLINYCFEVVI